MPAVPPLPARTASARSGALPSWLARLRATLAAWGRRHRQRRALARLDAALLRDIGLSAAEARRESAKPFWRR